MKYNDNLSYDNNGIKYHTGNIKYDFDIDDYNEYQEIEHADVLIDSMYEKPKDFAERIMIYRQRPSFDDLQRRGYELLRMHMHMKKEKQEALLLPDEIDIIITTISKGSWLRVMQEFMPYNYLLELKKNNSKYMVMRRQIEKWMANHKEFVKEFF